MCERARAALAEERERSKVALAQIAALERERNTLQSEINGQAAMFVSNRLYFICFRVFFASISAALSSSCSAVLQQQIGGMQTRLEELSDRVATLTLAKARLF